MAEVELRAGAKLDFLTKHEMRGVLNDWLVEIKRGVRYTRRSAGGSQQLAGENPSGVVPAGGILNLADPSMGPDASLVWAVPRISVRGLQSSESLSVYINSVDGFSYIDTIVGSNPMHQYGDLALPLNPNDRLIFNGTGLTVGEVITVNIQVIELPVQLAWQLIG